MIDWLEKSQSLNKAGEGAIWTFFLVSYIKKNFTTSASNLIVKMNHLVQHSWEVL